MDTVFEKACVSIVNPFVTGYILLFSLLLFEIYLVEGGSLAYEERRFTTIVP